MAEIMFDKWQRNQMWKRRRELEGWEIISLRHRLLQIEVEIATLEQQKRGSWIRRPTYFELQEFQSDIDQLAEEALRIKAFLAGLKPQAA